MIFGQKIWLKIRIFYIELYFWYLTAPRRFVMLLMRVFVNCARVELLPPRSEMLVRYLIDDDELSLRSDLVIAAAAVSELWPSVFRLLPSRRYEGRV